MFELTKFNAPLFKKSFAESIFDDLFPTSSLVKGSKTFNLDIKDNEKEYIIEADLPGVDKKEISINYENENLILSIERKDEKEDKNEKENYLHKERSYCSMKRSIFLPDIEPDSIKAKLENGVLKMTIMKEENKKNTKKIEIQ